MSFPTSLDVFPSSATLAGHNLDTDPHSTLHGNIGTALSALETKVGVDGSAISTSLDFKLGNAPKDFTQEFQARDFGKRTYGAQITANSDATHGLNVVYDAEGRVKSTSTTLITGVTPAAHASTHARGSTDPLDGVFKDFTRDMVMGGMGKQTHPVPPVAPASHAPTHARGAADALDAVFKDITVPAMVLPTGKKTYPYTSLGNAGGDLTGTYPNPTLVGVLTAGGPIGDATHTPTVTWDAKGRVTAVSSTLITGTVPAAHASTHYRGAADALDGVFKDYTQAFLVMGA